jgi:hypothetical protein
MAPDSRRRSSQATPAEISLVHNLKNCFVNLPSSLCSLLVNVNTVHSLISLVWRITDCFTAGPECHYRIELSDPASPKLKPNEWRANATIHLRGMDGDAK